MNGDRGGAAAVALAATLWPSRRATQLEAVTALRYESELEVPRAAGAVAKLLRRAIR